MGTSVAGAIKRAGGEEIDREAVSKGPIAVGEVIATGAGTLPHPALQTVAVDTVRQVVVRQSQSFGDSASVHVSEQATIFGWTPDA